jgi:signal transduction histidine kinase
MPNLIPLAVIHVGLSFALGAILILLYRRLSRADFLLYWALFWIDVGLNIAASQVATPLLFSVPRAPALLFSFSFSLTPTYPALMLCAAFSVGGILTRRGARRLLAGSCLLAIPLAIFHYLTSPPPGITNSYGFLRPGLNALAVLCFAWQLAVNGRREAGESRIGLVVASVLYVAHNFALVLGFYGTNSYSPWAAAVGITIQLGITIFLAWQAIKQAGAAAQENVRVLTELVSAQAELREREERLRVVFNAHEDLQSLVRVEPDGRFVNEAFNRAQLENARQYMDDPTIFLERGRDEFLRALGITEPAIERSIALWRQAASGGVPVHSYTSYLIGPAQRREIGEFAAVPILNSAGVCTHLLGTGRIVTERARMEEELRESKRRLEEAQQMARLGSFSGDPAASRMEWSDELFRICELDPARTVPSLDTVFALSHPEDHDSVRAAHAALLSTGHCKLQSRLLMPDGRIKHVMVRGEISVDGDGRPSLRGTTQDITERENTDREKARLEAQLHQAHKMESLGRLAGGVAHDFNNLLTVINGYSVMLAKDLEGPQRQYAVEIGKAGESAASLTRHLLAFSRMEVKRPEPVRVNHIIADSGEMLGRLVGTHIEIQTNLQASPDGVLADPHQIQQCLMNLVVNARDAMPAGGLLTIETASIELTADDLPRKSTASPGPHLRLTVRDTGIGMDESVRSHIFEPFFTTKESGSGTGLGLSTVYGIVSQWHGFVKVGTEPGKGSEFNLFLPLDTHAGLPHDLPHAQTSAPSSAIQTVLVVEDEENVRLLVAKSLTRCGYSVLQAENGAEALQLIERHGAGIQLLLTDFRMPGMRGNELAARAKILRPAMKVLFMTGHADGIFNSFGSSDQRHEVILKPFAPDALMDRVRELLLT